LGQDLLLIASIVYAIDKAVDRKKTADRWTRDLAVEIPVENVTAWQGLAAELSNCLGFLTGDRWLLSFALAVRPLIQKRARRKLPPIGQLSADAVCLFSGGLDSFIGAVDWFAANPGRRLLLSAHYDGDVPGPRSDQRALDNLLRPKFGARYHLVQTRVGLSSGGADNNFRSRSFLFLALGLYYAEVIGNNVPVLIPENGSIALNFPLTPTRRGSLSTRTVHPFFVDSLNTVLQRVGFTHQVINPYAKKTKAEMVTGCLDRILLRSSYAATRSCAKYLRKSHWDVRTARGCGVCVPCLFRRAALAPLGWDDEIYGVDLSLISSMDSVPSDLMALCAFCRRDHSKQEIERGLLANGSFDVKELSDYSDVVVRMRSEVRLWLGATAPLFVQNLAGL
jgi:7-cyano-7-deazaguanine synthase in queuosine biosynthesis